MSAMRDRAKEHFPTVLLTLLSIVQALALELLWSHIIETRYLLQPSLPALISWIQIVTTLLGLVLIWVVYASNAMRFRWVPVTSDSVYPFFIGLAEFMLIASLGPDDIGLWLILLTVIFAMMLRVNHKAMQRARHDGENDEFFSDFSPATWRDFAPQVAALSTLALAGVYLALSGYQGPFAVLVMLITAGMVGWQFYLVTRYWEQSVSDSPHVSSG